MTKPVFSRPVAVASVPPAGDVRRFEANEAERAAIASAFRLASVERFVVDVRMSADGQGGLTLQGAFDSDLHPVCVVTLEAFPQSLREPFTLRFVAPSLARTRTDEDFDLDSDDPPETVENGVVDIGEAALEFFALALDPYPRKPGAEFTFEPPHDAPENPFAALSALKRR
jgi:uncharacterized metal-binding protein YceD (DUF177 family)